MIDYEPDGRAAITAGENNPTENRGDGSILHLLVKGKKRFWQQERMTYGASDKNAWRTHLLI